MTESPKKTSQNLLVFVIDIIIGIIMVSIMLIFLNTVEWYLKLLAYLCIGGFTVSCAVFFFLKKESLFKTAFCCNVVTLIFVLTFFLLNLFGLFDSLKDLEKVKKIILDWGAYGYVVFVLLQLFQVIILPAPGFIFYLAGVAVYGPIEAFFISYASVVAGSCIAFLIGRYAGKPVVYWCVGKERTEKYLDLLGNKGNVLFVLMQILPFFPDDILCMVAGLTKMTFKFFLIVMLIVRPVYIGAVCFLATGDIIPFGGWGIFVWIALFLLCALAFVLYCKYQSRIEAKFASLGKKKNDKK